MKEMRTAERNDPLSPEAHWELGDALLWAGRYDEAAKQCENMPVDFELGNECLARARFFQGRTAEAIKILSADGNWGYLAYAYAKTGRREEAEKLIAEGTHKERRGAFQFALAFAGFGDKDRTIERLERYVRVGPVRIGFTLNSPEFAFVCDDPRVNALRKKVGLPE